MLRWESSPPRVCDQHRPTSHHHGVAGIRRLALLVGLHGLEAPLHLLGRHVLLVGRELPVVPEGVADRPEAVAPEHILGWHGHLGAGSDGPGGRPVDITRVDKEADRTALEGLRRKRPSFGNSSDSITTVLNTCISACITRPSGPAIRPFTSAPNAFL